MKNLFKLFCVLGICLITTSFIGCSDDDKSYDAFILEMSFDNPIVTTQPVIEGNEIKFYVKYNATEEDLKELVPTIKISANSTVNPASGSKVDFSGEPVQFTVTAEDGTKNIYKVTCEKSTNTESSILKMTFESSAIVKQPEITGNNIIFYVKGNTTATTLSKLKPIIEISDNATVTPASGSEVNFSGDPVKFTVKAEDGSETIYTVTCEKSTDTEASLLSITFDSPIVTRQPVINGNHILFYIAEDAKLSDLQELIPTFELSSDKATSNIVSGSKVDFSKGFVDIVVTAGDGKTKTTYKVSSWRNKHGFEEWFEEGTASLDGVKLPYYAPTGHWSSSNKGASFLISLGKKFVVTKSDDIHAGTGAARIETIQTNKLDGTGSSLFPVVTTGSLFLGIFETNYSNNLKSTKFGIIYDKKPLIVKGYYKYAPGPDFYRSSLASKNKVTLEVNTKDECAINAILYEVDDKDTYLTGEDAYDETKLTAIAKLADGTAKENYTPFTLNLNYLKQYDPTKKYRFAIICSSSKYGDTFSGAPGSVLYVDDIEIISE